MVAALIHPTKEEFYLPPDEQLRALVPYTTTKIKGKDYDVYPHRTDVTRLARNMGYIVPAPVLVRYPWDKVQAFQTQKVTAALLTMHRRAYVLSQMGTGKSRGALFAIDWMFRRNEIKKVLVVAPLSTLEHVWGFEVLKHFPDLSAVSLSGTKKRRLKRLAEHHHIYIINHEGVAVVLKELLAMKFDVVLIDELAKYRNKSTGLWESMNTLLQHIPYAWGMTGSPTPNDPTDAWAQMKLITPKATTKYFKQFRNATMNKLSQFRWIPKADANDTVFAAMQPAVRFTRDDCVELPDTHYVYRKVEQSDEQKRVYKELTDKLTIMLSEGQVTAVNEGVLYSKLLQVSSGLVYTKDRRIVDLDCSDRLNALEEIVDEADGKVIVFADFKHITKHVYDYLSEKGHEVGYVTGDVSNTERNKVFTRFKHDSKMKLLVAHPQCMAHGLTLTEANVIVWFTPTTSLDIYEQACARITRPGQTRVQMLIHLTGTTIESKVYRRLKEKAKIQGALLDMFSESN